MESRDKVTAHLDLIVALAILGHDRSGATYPLPVVNVGKFEEIMSLLNSITHAIVREHKPGYAWHIPEIEFERFFGALRKSQANRQC